MHHNDDYFYVCKYICQCPCDFFNCQSYGQAVFRNTALENVPLFKNTRTAEEKHFIITYNLCVLLKTGKKSARQNGYRLHHAHMCHILSCLKYRD